MWSKTGTQSPRSSFLSYQSKLSLLHLLLPFSFILKVCREISSENSPDFFQSYPKVSLTLPFFAWAMSHTKSFFFHVSRNPFWNSFLYKHKIIIARNHRLRHLSWFSNTLVKTIFIPIQCKSEEYVFACNSPFFFAHFRAEVNVLWLICAFWICQASWIAKCRMKEGKGLVNTQQHLQQLYFATALNQLKAAELLTFACLDFKHIGCPKIYTYDLQMSEL